MGRRKEDIMRGGILRLLVFICFAIAALILLHPVKAEAAGPRTPFAFNWEGTGNFTLFFNRGANDAYIEVNGERKYISDGGVYGNFEINWGSWWKNGYHYNTAVKYRTGNHSPIIVRDSSGREVARFNPPSVLGKSEHDRQPVTVHFIGDLNETNTAYLNGDWYGSILSLKPEVPPNQPVGIYKTNWDGKQYGAFGFARTGYTIDGFGFSPNDVSDKRQKDAFTYFGINDQVYVKYTANSYDFDLQDGPHGGKLLHGTADVYVDGTRVADDVRDYHQVQKYKSEIVVKDIKPDPGYHYDGPKEYKATMGTKGVIINVTDFKPNTYTVKYDGNDASDGFMNDSTATYDAEFVTRQNAFSKTGYDFDGWNEKADGSGTAWGLNNYGVYENGNGTKPWHYAYPHDITLYAQWKYNVVFDPNLDSVSTVGNVVNTGMPSAASPLVCHYQVGQKLPSNTYSIYGYTFVGWSTNKTDVDAQYADGATILSNPTPNNGTTVTLYAIWKIDSYPITYKLQKDSDAEIDMPGTVSLANKKTVVYPAHGGLYFENPRLTNEKFTGWTCAELGNTDKTKDLTISSDQIRAWYEAKTDKHDNVGITMVAHFEAVPPFEFVDSKTGQTPILNETEKNQGKFRVEEVESSPGYIYEDQYHDIDIHDNDDTHEYQDSDYRNLTFPEKNGK